MAEKYKSWEDNFMIRGACSVVGLACTTVVAFDLSRRFFGATIGSVNINEENFLSLSLSKRIDLVAKMMLAGIAIGATVGGVVIALPMLAFTATPSYSLLIPVLAFSIIGLVYAAVTISEMMK